MSNQALAVAPLTGKTQLRLASGNGPVYRHVLQSPLRDAEPWEIPVINISRIFSASPSDRMAVAREFKKAATNNGFFYISGHGIPSEAIDRAYNASLNFFRQPSSIKDRINVNRSRHYSGWKPPGATRINSSESVDHRETFSWRYDPNLDPSVQDISAIPQHISQYFRHETESFYNSATAELPKFQEDIKCYREKCLTLARALVRTLALSLDLPEDALDSKFSHPDATLVLNYYPSLPDDTETVLTKDGSHLSVSLGSHTDFQLFTVLWQDSVGDLQVLNGDGQWLRAPPVPGTLTVNMGDYLQYITNGKYKSTVHRVQNISGTERVSMPFFFGFNLNESCGVLESCVEPGDAKQLDEISCLEWVKRRMTAMKVSENEA